MKLKVKDISKNYNRYSALRGVNLELEPGLYGLLAKRGRKIHSAKNHSWYSSAYCWQHTFGQRASIETWGALSCHAGLYAERPGNLP